MRNFELSNPTKIIFGEGQIANLSQHIPSDAKILMTYGGGSIKKNGVYEQVKQVLSQHTLIEFAGIEANPHYETLMEAVNVVKEHQIDFLLAVGGGSVIDGTKFIAAATYFQGEPWDILSKAAPVTKALPLAAVLTLAATGSEMNGTSVVTHAGKKSKRAFRSPLVNPQFSILDPTVTFSLPARQIGNGIVDSFTHVVEQYLTYDVNTPLQDRFAESILQTLVETGPITFNNPQDYDARANFMWCATMALNGLLSAGVVTDWATHMIGHALTALHGLDHAQTLAVVLPNVLNIQRQQKKEKLLQYAERVWHITEGDDETRIDQVIAKTREFFESVGVKTHLRDYNIDESAIPALLEYYQHSATLPVGEHGDIDLEKIEAILRAAL